MNTVNSFIAEVMEMQDEISRLRRENARLQRMADDYQDLLRSTRQHQERMIGNTLLALVERAK